ncbi:MAG TPA: CoA pyrophosphatase [Bacteroidia bacterium]|nr:CoA pyrophosphatase [Bacteroidia bacterium]
MDFWNSISVLEKRFKEPLPGSDAQVLMAPETRLSNEEYLKQFPEHRISSVLFLLFPSDGKTNFVLIERSGGGVHSGQIALPGGKYEASDVTYENTALRETEEEIGVNKNEIRLLGTLTDLFIPASKFRVYPHVGLIENKPDFVPHQLEVKSIVEADLGTFLEKNIIHKKNFKTSYGQLSAPYYLYHGYEIWGATAMLVSEFLTMFKQK